MNENETLSISLVGYSLGLAGGEYYNKKYNNSSENEKRKWNEDRIMHHGVVGIIAGIIGIIVLIFSKLKWLGMLLISIGIGLMQSDLNDIDRWLTDGAVFE